MMCFLENELIVRYITLSMSTVSPTGNERK